MMGISARIARFGVESRERFGRWPWVVKRNLGWLHRFRRLRIRHERRADMHQALISLACSLICWRYVERFCQAFLIKARQQRTQVALALPGTALFA
jgi:hypothetical protein